MHLPRASGLLCCDPEPLFRKTAWYAVLADSEGNIFGLYGTSPHTPEPGKEAHWQGYDTRHTLAEIDPAPDQITIVIGSTQMNILPLTTQDDVKGTQLQTPPCRRPTKTW
jgi:hypothetical protein